MGRKPEYIRIRELLAGEIRSNPGMVKLPTEAEMCRQYKIGRSTLRKALEILTAENIIEARPGLGTYIKTANLIYPQVKRKLIGYLFDNGLHRRFWQHNMQKMSAVIEGLAKYDYSAEIFAFNCEKDPLAEITQADFDGIIWSSPLEKHILLIREIRDIGIPVILTETYPFHDLNVVTTDNFKLGQMSAEYLIKRGHKHFFTLIGGIDEAVYKEKINGILKAMEVHKISTDDFCVITLNDSKYKVDMLQNAKEPFTACLNLTGSANMYKYFEENYLPDSLKNIDIISLDSKYTKEPAIIEQLQNSGYTAAEKMHELLNDKIKSPFTIKFSPILINVPEDSSQ